MDRRRFLLALASLPGWRANAAPALAETVEYPAVLPGRSLVFPADHGAHPAFRTEWWYATGWLNLADGSPLGFQCTFFRVRTGIGENNPSAFAPRQLVFAHAAIADPRLGRLRHEQRMARVGFGRAGFTAGQTDVWIGDWRLDQREDRYRAEVRGEDFAYTLSLAPDSPPLRNGAGGFSAKAPDARHASYYYSRPQLRTAGQVTLDGRRQQASGLAWLDHEWSSELLPPSAQGWDWIGINMADGSALMAFQLRSSDSAALWTAATMRLAGSSSRTLPREAVAFAPLRHWRSPRTGIRYPVEWRVRIGTRWFHLLPLFDDQELDSRLSTGTVYWEGAVRVVEDDREIGRGYLEMTGYGERIRLG